MHAIRSGPTSSIVLRSSAIWESSKSSIEVPGGRRYGLGAGTWWIESRRTSNPSLKKSIPVSEAVRSVLP